MLKQLFEKMKCPHDLKEIRKLIAEGKKCVCDGKGFGKEREVALFNALNAL